MQHDNGKAKDFKVLLNVKNGVADIYLTTYVESNDQNMLARLPKSKRDVQWIREGVDSKSSESRKGLLVLN
jgi:hypothetical protein